MPMRNRVFTVFLFTAVFVSAFALRAAYPPLPRVVLPAQNLTSLEQIGNAAYSNRPMPESLVAAVGLPILSDAYGEVVHQYIIRAVSEHPDVLIFTPRGFKVGVSAAQIYGLEPQELSQLFRRVTPLIHDSRRVLLVMPLSESSHRLAQNFMTQLEKSTKIQIPTLTLAEIALSKQNEVNLQPNCRASLRDGDGGVFDLGCLVLAISRKFQAQDKSPEDSFMYAESEMSSENILAIFHSAKGK